MKLTKSDMERMATDLREKLQLSDDDKLDPFQISITGVKVLATDQLEGLTEKSKDHLDGEGHLNWSAMSVPLDNEQDSWAILINKTHDIERQRVSLLEELWHIIQGHKLTVIVRIGTSYGRSFESDDEHDAYYLAAATLLPETGVRRGVSQKSTAKDIAEKYGTSQELVEYRIKRLGLWNEYKGREIRLIQK